MVISGLLWTILYWNEVPIDVTALVQIIFIEESLFGKEIDGLILKILVSFGPLLYSYISWVLTEVCLALFVGNSLFLYHPVGTTISLMLSYIYIVEPSAMIATNYFIHYDLN